MKRLFLGFFDDGYLKKLRQAGGVFPGTPERGSCEVPESEP